MAHEESCGRRGSPPSCATSPVMGYYDVASQLTRHVYARADRAWDQADRVRDALRTPEELALHQRTLRQRFLQAIGGLPRGEPAGGRPPPPAEVLGVSSLGPLRIERLLFEPRPRVFVPANLWLPSHAREPAGGVLFLCGHYERAKLHDEYLRGCGMLASAGFAVLIYDPEGQGERLAYLDPARGVSRVGWGCPEHEYANWQAWPLGGSPTRWFLDDALRALDLLAARPEVDPGRLGVTGSSGGGSLACAMMFVDDRLRAAAPATSVTGLRQYMLAGGALDSEETWPGVDGCTFDYEDALLCFAPRPLLVLAARSDFFPIEGTRRTVGRARRYWDIAGCPSCIELLEADASHNFTPELAAGAVRFFSLHLGGHGEGQSTGMGALPEAGLACTRSGQVGVDRPEARFVRHEVRDAIVELERLRGVRPEAGGRERAVAWLRDRAHRGRVACEPNVRCLAEERLAGLEMARMLWWAQEGVFNHGLLVRDPGYAGRCLPAVVAVWDGGTAAVADHLDWIRPACSSGTVVLVLDVSGVGALLPNDVSRKDPWEDDGILYLLAHTLIRIGDSLPALRVHDVLRALEVARTLPGVDGDRVGLYAAGRHGLYALLAALIDEKAVPVIEGAAGVPSISSWAAESCYEHRDVMSVAFPGILPLADIAEARRWLGARLSRDASRGVSPAPSTAANRLR